VRTPGWETIDKDEQEKLAAPLERGKAQDKERVPIPQLRSELDACEARLRDAIAELHRIIDGDRVATVRLGSYFSGGIETEEQLDALSAASRGVFPADRCRQKSDRGVMVENSG